MNWLREYKRIFFIGGIVFIIHLIFIIISNFNERVWLYIKLTDIFCGSIAVVLSLLTIFRKNFSFYKYLGIGFISIGILEYSKIFLGTYVYRDIKADLFLYTTSCLLTLELLIVIAAMFFMKNKFSNFKAFMGYLSVMLITWGFIYFIRKFEIKYIVLILNIALVIFLFFLIRKEDNIENKYINIYLIIIAAVRIITLGMLIFNNYAYILPNCLQTIAYFVIYEAIAKNIYSLEISSMKNEIKDNKKEEGIILEELQKRLYIMDMLDIKKSNEETRYYNLIDDFNDGIILYGEKIRYANKSAAFMLGIEDNKNFSEKNFFKKIQWVERNKRRAKIYVENNWIYIEIYTVKISDNVFMIYMKDITEIKIYEEKIREYESCLRYEDIQNEFFTNISHELRTPINIINVALELNKIDIEKNEFDKVKENNKKIKKNCLRLIRTINNFIDANKFSEGYFKINKGIFNIVEVVENVVTHCIDSIEANNMNIIFDSTHEEIPLNIDRDAIERVILNLLSNSVKHRNKNRDDGQIKVDIRKTDKNVEIIVANNGQRINKIEEGYLFDEFTKINKSLTRENEGSGLGLYLSKKLLFAHSGALRFYSKDKANNIFIIELPIEEGLTVDYKSGYSINDLKEKVNIEFSDVI
ncbi:sensor histidine kinase [Clostridium thermobutyricum]|uniref:histidine kinase n=1 Tax=Clostridium thermobutyricum DSM 4928 TaxID=1121339 RepID=A0A1V4SZA2_9CLOT|nr:HAMP domain-containing sensor histidine kinase [Clostridium thermobutyricum]OPX49609.1 alginate biosynthesis sensor protein KinB [Clostridium thermobutyricum DSM 4928]